MSAIESHVLRYLSYIAVLSTRPTTYGRQLDYIDIRGANNVDPGSVKRSEIDRYSVPQSDLTRSMESRAYCSKESA